MGLTNLNSIGIVKVGVAFVWKSGPDTKQKLLFDGKLLTVVGFMPANYVNRVVLKDPEGSEMLMPLSMVEKMLTSQPAPPSANAADVAEAFSEKPKSEVVSKEVADLIDKTTRK